MNAGLLILIGALSAGLTAGYTTRIISRAPDAMERLNSQGIFRSAIGALGFISILATLVWGFINLTWWWVILAFLGVSLFIVPILHGGTERFSIMFYLQPVFDVISIALCLVLWFVI